MDTEDEQDSEREAYIAGFVEGLTLLNVPHGMERVPELFADLRAAASRQWEARG